MFNIKWGLTAAIFAMFISVTLGIFSGVNILHIIIRAAIFFIVFFALGSGLRFIIDNFFPELLISADESGVQDSGQPGARVNFTVDNTGEYAVPELFKTSDSEKMGNIEDLISGNLGRRNMERGRRADTNGKAEQWFETSLSEEGVDRKYEEGYNEEGDFRSIQEFPQMAEKPVVKEPEIFESQFTPSLGEDSGLGGLPDLDIMARAFSSDGSGSPVPASSQGSTVPASLESFTPLPVVGNLEQEKSPYVGNKPQPLQVDFDPGDLAKGISTILRKD